LTIKTNGSVITAVVDVPEEVLMAGPRGYRVSVVDYDATRQVFYEPGEYPPGKDYGKEVGEEVLRNDVRFHAQNVYAIVMRTLARFEFALGRRVPWGFYGHHLYVTPHAFEDANAFYSERDHALLFGYFRGTSGNTVLTCLSHDVVAHEATHGLLDGLRDHYTDPSLPDQPAFHEGFADTVALLSMFSLPELVEGVIGQSNALIDEGPHLDADWLKRSALLGLAEQMGQELSPSTARRDALRLSARMTPDPLALEKPEFEQHHRRGEVLVAALMGAFVNVWETRLKYFEMDEVPLDRIFEEGANAADHLLTIAVRALDYCPPVDLTFADYLSAVLTADRELFPDDRPYGYRELLRQSFAAWGIVPASTQPEGTWESPKTTLRYEGVHFESLQRDEDEVFRFLWENRKDLCMYEDAFTKVNWVRPVVRVGPDGFVLSETVAEYIQIIEIEAGRLDELDIDTPDDLPDDAPVTLYGGGTLLFDEFGQLKYEVHKSIDNETRQAEKIAHWWTSGTYGARGKMGVPLSSSPTDQFALWHRLRMAGISRGYDEVTR
jgi:hypothetical protein